MKKLLLILLFLPSIIFSQNSNGFFNFSKDAFYYDKMSEWQDKIYDDIDSKFETLIDNDSIFAFSARGYFFEEMYQLNFDKNKRIKKIELFFNVHNGDLNEWFPNKYPVNIGETFKVLGNPNITTDDSPYFLVNSFQDSEFTFQKYYKWNNVLYQDTKVAMEIATLKVKKPIKNKRGKIRKYQLRDYGYISYIASGNGNVTDKDKNFTTVSQISNGARKSWQKNSKEMISLLGEKRFNTSNSWFDKSILPYLLYIENTNDPKEYFKKFFFYANVLYNIDFNDQFSYENQKYTYTSLPDGVIAKAKGMNKSCCIEILIDLENWNDSTYLDKLFIMFHELGHDIFDLNHSDGIRLMTTNKITFDDPSILGEMIHEMMFSILKQQKRLRQKS